MRQAVSGGSSAPKASGKASATEKQAAVSAPASRQVSADEQKKRIAQLAEMGIAIPEEYRADMALAGDWQTVSETKIQEPDELATKSIGVRKRKHDGGNDDEEDQVPEQYENKGWGSRMRSYPNSRDNDGDDGDLDALLASTRELKKIKNDSNEYEAKEYLNPDALSKDEEAAEPNPEAHTTTAVKAEEVDDTANASNKKPTSSETPGVVFKKRKPKAMRK